MNCSPGCGILFVLSAPSGAGKTTLAEYLINKLPHIKRSISYTTRPKREGEKNGRDYHFVEMEQFQKMVMENAFIEYAQVHGNMYGTTYEAAKEAKANKCDLLLVIDVQGAEKLRHKDVDKVSIFILPPSMKLLKERLSGRGTDSKEAMGKRLQVAEEEIAQCRNYDYLIVNDDLKYARKELEGIVRAERCKRERKVLSFPDYSVKS